MQFEIEEDYDDTYGINPPARIHKPLDLGQGVIIKDIRGKENEPLTYSQIRKNYRGEKYLRSSK